MENGKTLFKNSQESSVQQTSMSSQDSFLSYAFHELKSPLTSISLQLEFLLRQIGDYKESVNVDRVKQTASGCLKQVQKMTDTIKDLVLFTQTLKSIDANVCNVNLSKVVIECLEQEIPKDFSSPISVELDDLIVGKWNAKCLELLISYLLKSVISYPTQTRILVSSFLDKELYVPVFLIQGISEIAQPEELEEVKDLNEMGMGMVLAGRLSQLLGATLSVEKTPLVGFRLTLRLP